MKMPFNLAVFGSFKAGLVTRQHEYTNWYIGGHSFGGIFAAKYASHHSAEFKGVILCASYPLKKMDNDLVEIIIYGSEDLVINRNRIIDSRRFASERYVEYIIEGGNHAGFGNYGIQKGDGEATISASEQQEEAIQVILNNTK